MPKQFSHEYHQRCFFPTYNTSRVERIFPEKFADNRRKARIKNFSVFVLWHMKKVFFPFESFCLLFLFLHVFFRRCSMHINHNVKWKEKFSDSFIRVLWHEKEIFLDSSQIKTNINNAWMEDGGKENHGWDNKKPPDIELIKFMAINSAMEQSFHIKRMSTSERMNFSFHIGKLRIFFRIPRKFEQFYCLMNVRVNLMLLAVELSLWFWKSKTFVVAFSCGMQLDTKKVVDRPRNCKLTLDTLFSRISS